MLKREEKSDWSKIGATGAIRPMDIMKKELGKVLFLIISDVDS